MGLVPSEALRDNLLQALPPLARRWLSSSCVSSHCLRFLRVCRQMSPFHEDACDAGLQSTAGTWFLPDSLGRGACLHTTAHGKGLSLWIRGPTAHSSAYYLRAVVRTRQGSRGDTLLTGPELHQRSDDWRSVPEDGPSARPPPRPSEPDTRSTRCPGHGAPEPETSSDLQE